MIEEFCAQGLLALSLVIVAAWRALPLILIALLAGVLLRQRLAAKYHALLWMLVVVRMFLPISLPMPWSMQGPMDRLSAYLFGVPGLETHQISNPYQIQDLTVTIGQETLAPNPLEAVQAAHAEPGLDPAFIVALTIVTAWMVIAIAMLLRGVVAHVLFARRLRACRELKDPALVDVVLRECDALGVSRRPRIQEVPELATPAVFGLVRPTICLPVGVSETLSPQELRWVLRHELAHVRRGDAWLLCAASVMTALHWFNPLAWLTKAQLRKYLEAAADDLAMGHASTSECVEYGRMLLRFAEQSVSPKSSPALGLLYIVSAKRLRHRIESLTGPRAPRGRFVRFGLVAMLAFIAAASLTDAQEKTVQQEPAVFLSNLDVSFAEEERVDEGPMSTKIYEVADVLKQIRAIDPEADPKDYFRLAGASWDDGQVFHLAKNQLLVHATEARHAALVELLLAWRESGPRQVVMELRGIRTDVSLAASIDWAAARVGDLKRTGERPVTAARITDEQLRQFMQRVQSDARSSMLMAPKVTVFNGQTASVAMQAQRPFVTDVQPDESGQFKPVIDIVKEGLKVELQPVVAANGSTALSLKLEVSEIASVALANLPHRNADQPDRPLTVQVPHVDRTTVETTVALPATESVLIAIPQLFDEEHPDASTTSDFYVITPRVLDVDR